MYQRYFCVDGLKLLCTHFNALIMIVDLEATTVNISNHSLMFLRYFKCGNQHALLSHNQRC